MERFTTQARIYAFFGKRKEKAEDNGQETSDSGVSNENSVKHKIPH